MGQYLSQPVTTKESGKGENESLKYGMAAMQGWRVCMVRVLLCLFFVFLFCVLYRILTHVIHGRMQEDSHIVSLDMGDSKKTSIFAVFDGHGGKLVAMYVAKHLENVLRASEHFQSDDLGLAIAESFYKIDADLESPEGIAELQKLAGVSGRGSISLFPDVEGIEIPEEEKKAGKKPPRQESTKEFIESALARNSVIPTDQITGMPVEETVRDDDSDDYAEHKATGMGCTAVAALIRGRDVTIANTGDSRCVISRSGIAEPLTLDHKPVLLEEAERIMNAGGFVRDNRVNGALNVSRTIGDLDFKRNDNLPHTHQMVVATPDITTFELQKGDEFLILACDGIWDVLSNQEAVDFVRKRIKQGQDLGSICEDMCDHCLAPDLKGLCRGADNMSVIILLFRETAELSGPWLAFKRAFLRLGC